MSYSNDDLAPVQSCERTWTVRHFISLWVGMSFSIPAYMLASSLLVGGMSWWQAILAIFVGNCIILIPMLLNSHAGTAYGIPFPIYVRASFGIRGAHVPALIRALIACGWFGIQSWIGAEALYGLLTIISPSISQWQHPPAWLGIDSGHLLSFSLFWLFNIVVIYKGMNWVRKLLLAQSVILIATILAAAVWAFSVPDSLHGLVSHQASFKNSAAFWAFFFPALTGIVGFFSTICLNIPDFTRFAKTQRDQIIGQSISLPVSMTLVTFIGVFVTTASYLQLGKMVWDPVVLARFIPSLPLRALLLLTILFITLVANVALNIVSPANDFAHLWPSKINFKRGGLLTAVIAFAMMPWKLIADPNGYVFIWLIGVSALLGSIVGIMLCDYYLVRGRRINRDALYEKHSEYWYTSGINYKAMVALVLGILPNIPGFLVETGLLKKANVAPLFLTSYDYAWFVGLAISLVIYRLLMGKK